MSNQKQCSTCLFYTNLYEPDFPCCENEDSENYYTYPNGILDSCDKWKGRVSGDRETAQETVFSHGNYMCPRCGNMITTNNDTMTFFRYCGGCGQKLKWDNVLPDEEKHRILPEYREDERK